MSERAIIITGFAPAKVNLFLHVTGNRSDGYHTLHSCFLPLAYGDEMQFFFDESPGIRLACDIPELTGGNNLAVKAAKRYCEMFSLEPACRIVLRKKIFCAAGLGGGSSDAAQTLLAFEKHYRCAGEETLKQLALTLGADVPFFLNPRPAIAGGIGETLQPIAWSQPFDILLANPRFPVSTKEAYRNCRIAAAPELPEDWTARPEEFIVNTLAERLWTKFPLLEILKQDLLSAGACGAGISGSGPTLFALFRKDAAWQKNTETMQKKYENAVHFVKTEVLF